MKLHRPTGWKEFLDEAGIFDLEARTEDRTDFSIAFWHPEAPLAGFNVRSRLSTMNPLLDGGRAANLKLEQWVSSLLLLRSIRLMHSRITQRRWPSV